MKPYHFAFAVFTFLLPCLALGVGDAKKTFFPATTTLKVDLELMRHVDEKGEERVSGVLRISNPSQKDLIIQHPENRLALAFLVTDSLGNVVSPRGNAKVDPSHRTEKLKGGGTYAYPFEQLWFLTGSARFGYELKKEQNYKIIALFRPAGPTGPGFTSNEVLLATIP